MQRALIVVNPQARDGKISERWQERFQEISNALPNWELSTFWTTKENRGAKEVRDAVKRGIQKIIVVGGDGTLTEVIQGFFENGKPFSTKDTEISILPAGRGDDFFKTLTHQRFFTSRSAWRFALQILNRGSPQKIDVGMLQWLSPSSGTPRAFINIASFGYPGLVVHKVHSQAGALAKTRLGKSAWAYVLQGLSALIDYRRLEMRVSVDDQIYYQGKVFSGFVLNGQFNAGGICWSRDARVDDGWFHLILLKKPWSRPQVVVAKKVSVEILDPRPKTHPYFEIDGELLEESETRGATFQILPRALLVNSTNALGAIHKVNSV